MNHRFLLLVSLAIGSAGILLTSPSSAELSNRLDTLQIAQRPKISNSTTVNDRPLGSVDRQERPDWASFFNNAEAQGTIVILDQRGDTQQLWVYDQERADRAYSPASTFKIPHSLFALDAGVVQDEFQVFEWDGVERDFAPHNQAQTLRSAMRNSAVWVYESFADEIGEAKAREYLTQIDYGNADPSTSEGAYWIDGALVISAQEQIYFLQKLYQNELPFRVEHQRLVKDIMIVEAERDWILRAKTGWEGR
ncbi:class D beta-lactamase, partial [Nodosilinea sp. LEGE 07298]|uniref:class D beta-lactamase n=1 Tax=Nodosilinea sp. LEGE 07298 TaxID=2777970 RepID=UPI0018828E76